MHKCTHMYAHIQYVSISVSIPIYIYTEIYIPLVLFLWKTLMQYIFD